MKNQMDQEYIKLELEYMEDWDNNKIPFHEWKQIEISPYLCLFYSYNKLGLPSGYKIYFNEDGLMDWNLDSMAKLFAEGCLDGFYYHTDTPYCEFETNLGIDELIDITDALKELVSLFCKKLELFLHSEGIWLIKTDHNLHTRQEMDIKRKITAEYLLEEMKLPRKLCDFLEKKMQENYHDL
jgi:hypothetical protein